MLLVIFMLVLPAAAQQISGMLSGTVHDASGGVIPDAKVVLTNAATSAARNTVSNVQGYFSIPAIQPGTYSLAVTVKGFQQWETKGIVISQGDQRNLSNITLQVGAEAAEVTVEALAGEVAPVDSGEKSLTLNESMIRNIAIQGRSAGELIKFMPGMAMNNGGSQGAWNSLASGTNNGPVGAYSANGTQPAGGLTMISDGANVVDSGNSATQIANINQDMVEELKILSSNYGAEYAKGPIVFQAVTKGGGSQFHGEGYLYGRHSTLNSEDSYLKNQGRDKPEDHYYYPGGNIGGPVLIPGTRFNKNRDKLFFFVGYEYMNQVFLPDSNKLQTFVPTPTLLGGDFSPASLSALGSKVASTYSGLVAAPANFPGGIIPKSRFDPLALNLAKVFPAPNADAQQNSGHNYVSNIIQSQNRWEVKAKADYNITEKTRLSFTFGKQKEKDYVPINLWWTPGDAVPYPSAMVAPTVGNQYSANLVHTFSPTLTNELQFAYASYLNAFTFEDLSKTTKSGIGFNVKGVFKNGIQQLPNIDGWDQGIPTLHQVGGFGTAFQNGSFGALKREPNVSDTVTKVWRTHTMKFGAYWDFSGNQQTGSGATQGNYVITNQNWGGYEGNPIANFLMGQISQYNETNFNPVYDMLYRQISFFAQDSWKVTPRLTLSLGLRLDHFGQWTPTNGPGQTVWDPALYNPKAALGSGTGLSWHALNSNIPMSGFKAPLFLYDPRLGIAYDLFGNGKTVLRGGIGLFRYSESFNDVQGAYDFPQGIRNTSISAGCIGYTCPDTFAPDNTPIKGGVTALLNGDNKRPTTWSYSFTISQQLPARSLAEFSYVGNQTNNAFVTNELANVNKVPLGALFQKDPITGAAADPANANLDDYRPYQLYQGISARSHGAWQNYNSFQASWKKQAGRLTALANYTFGKALGIRDGSTGNYGGNGGLVDPFNIGNNYGPLAYDRTHVINFAYVLQMGRPLHINPFVNGVVNGWTLSGTTQWQSGAPLQTSGSGLGGSPSLNAQYPGLTLTQGNIGNKTLLGTDALQLMPILTCDPRKGLSSGQYFNPNCFASPSIQGQNGSIIWPYVKTPAFFNSDLSVYKNFHITEQRYVEFRFSAFNFLNHPLRQFGLTGGADAKLDFTQNVAGGKALSATNTNTLTTGSPAATTGRRVAEFAIKFHF